MIFATFVLVAAAQDAHFPLPDDATRSVPSEVSAGERPDDAFIEWNAGLGAIHEDRARSLRLDRARRVAPFDLTFGLQE
jgi:hypothetical protein